jgi:hypothetical protein
MRNKKLFTEILGKDNQGDTWYILIDETYFKSENNVSFYVFPEENLNKDVRWKALHIMRSFLSIIPPDECVMLDFAHNEYDTSYKKDDETYIHRPPSIFDEIFDENYSAPENWENLGIGTLLLKRIESWAFSNGIKLIKGSLSSSDNIEKLKYFYGKNGWIVEIPGRTYDLPSFVLKGIGIVYKKIGA